MAFYTCEKCLFSFERRGPVEACPDCGRENLRDATTEEIAELKNNRMELNGGFIKDESRDGCGKMGNRGDRQRGI
jgi:hypothetical protein